MKLREVIRAISGFLYEVNEYDVFPNGKISKRLVKLQTDETNIRCLQHGMHHEKLVNGSWFIINSEEFDQNLKAYSQNKIVVRKSSGSTEKKDRVKLSVVDLLIPTTHFYQRLQERFGIEKSETLKFLKEKFQDHFIVQNYKFYNGGYNKYQPNDIVVCSRDFKVIFVVSRQKGKYVLITCYNPMTPGYEAFENWFTDNLEKVHEMPKLSDFMVG